MIDQEQAPHKDFFISYTGVDRLWAEWIAWQLEDAGYSIIFQTSFPPGHNFVEEMKTALEETTNTVAVFSPDYIEALSMSAEWSEALSVDHSNKQKMLIPVQVREMRNRLKALLPIISYLDIAGLDEQEASKVLREGISGVSRKPPTSPFHTFITVGHPRFPGSFPLIWNVPYQRNLYFTGREALLTQLAQALQPETIMPVIQPQAISGLGGIGKTQLAIEYAYRSHQDYDAVFWVTAHSREAIVADYVNIARLLELPQQSEQNQTLTILAVKHWLQTHSKWLLILDNADDVGIVREFLPSASSGHILLTTRAYSLGTLAERLVVDTLPSEEGILFLLHRAGLINHRSTLTEVQSADIDSARILVEELGSLPLALDQAGAYIQETGCCLLDYIKLYRAQRKELLELRGGAVTDHAVIDHPQPVATTWTLAFDKIARNSPAAVELLQLCTFLASDDIPEELITEGGPDFDPELKSIVDDPMALNRTIALLLQYSLMSRDSSKKTLSIHHLVQAVFLDKMNEKTAHESVKRAVRIINRVFPSGEFRTWTQCDRLLPHALRCVDWVEQYHLFLPEAMRLLNQAGYYLSERARYSEAEALWKRALEISDQQPESEYPDTATSLNNLAQLYQQQQKYVEAEQLYQRALKTREELLGPEHPDVAASLYNLADLYRKQGKDTEAEPLYQRALTIREQQLGPERLRTATSLNDLAQLYRRQDKYEEAEQLYQRALAIHEQLLGPDHLCIATSLNNLAELYQQQGRYKETEQSYQRALAIREQQLGHFHPDTATSLNKLAQLYRQQGKNELAEPLLRRALTIYEQVLGPEHPDTVLSLNNLVAFYNSQGQHEQAKPLYQRARAIHERAVGQQNTTTATTRQNMASSHQGSKQKSKAKLPHKVAGYQQESTKQKHREVPDIQ